MIRIIWQQLITLFVVLILLQTSSFAQNGFGEMMKNLTSEEDYIRQKAIKALTDYLNELHKTDKGQSADKIWSLIVSLTKKGKSDDYKFGVCDALRRINFFWKAGKRQDEAEKRLYNLYQETRDTTLQSTIDKALMKADGLYGDAIRDFNQDRYGKAVIRKFERTMTYPRSQYAALAHYYLGLLYYRTYCILERKNQNPNAADYLTQSNAVLGDFLRKTEYQSRKDLVAGARYFRSLNFIILNRFDDATNELRQIESASSREEKIYIYQFYYSDNKNDIIDKYYDAKILAAYTLNYLNDIKYHKRNFESLVRYLKMAIDPVTGMEFVWVPGGCYQMGCGAWTSGDCEEIREKPVHKVCLDGFWIGKYEVTQGEWKKIMRKNPSIFKYGDNYPVEGVSWEDTKKFIKKLNKKTNGSCRLPTEAEWEYACRSGGKPEKYAGGTNVTQRAWSDEDRMTGLLTRPVGRKRPNGLGIYDMSGNVWEWCEDVYHNYPTNNSRNIIDKGFRVCRGGSWKDFPTDVRCGKRKKKYLHEMGNTFGFRLVRMP